MVQPGTYRAKIVDYGIVKIKSGVNAGKPAPNISFQVECEGKLEQVSWQGSFNEGRPREIAMNALITCGLTLDKFHMLSAGPAFEALNIEQEVNVVVEHEQAIDGSGKVYPRVKWINPLNSRNLEKMGDQEFRMQLESMGLKASFLQASRAKGAHAPLQTPKEPVSFNPFM